MKKYDAETLKALKGSISKWKSIVEGTGVDHGTANCNLCQLFMPNEDGFDCRGCPAKVGDDQHCDCTPYEAWCDHHRLAHRTIFRTRLIPECAECVKLAKEELKFLQGLLPKATKRARR